MRTGRRAIHAAAIISGVVLGVTSAGAGEHAGARIVFSRGSAPEKYELWSTRSDGRDFRRVTSSCGWDWWPAVSPDGRSIAFARSCNGDFDLYVVGVDGRALRRVVHRPGNDTWPTWSPDGRRIAFVGGDDRRAELYVVNAFGTGLRRLTHNGVEDAAPAWSPDGRTVLYTSLRSETNALMLISPSRRTTRRLGDLRGGEPAWSPDGRRIAFALRDRGAEASETVNLFVASADGRSVRQLTHEKVGVVSHHPSWSPNGRRIVFISNRAARFEGASLYIVNADGTGLRRLTRARFEDVDPVWPAAPKAAAPR